MSPVQQTVTMDGFVPVMLTVDPGIRVAAWEEMASTSAASWSSKPMLKQTGIPSHTSMALTPVSRTLGPGGSPGPAGPVSCAGPCGAGAEPVHAMETNMMSRMTEPMSTPLASYWSTCTTNTYLPIAGGVKVNWPVVALSMVPGTGWAGLNPGL